MYYAELAGTNLTECELPEGGDELELLDDVRGGNVSDGGAHCGQVFQATSKLPNQGPCFPVFSRTVDFMNRCIPDMGALLDAFPGMSEDSNNVGDALSESTAVMQRYFNDLERGIGIVLLCGLLLAMVASLVWMFVLRFFAGVMAWVAVILANLIALAVCVLCFQKAGLLGKAGAAGEVSEVPHTSLRPPFTCFSSPTEVYAFSLLEYSFSRTRGRQPTCRMS
jgi:hypothetical protein